ncbi:MULTISPECIES: Clp protease N-terminal domain-containing protein [unclassified Microbacterium]|uniref:SRPBCC family protein n=1 Tax=unclassified Microbacterium TaxID=2609290 RepID=UPI00214C805E|nr:MULTISPECIES: Clp protease N-terminal domain-containing protein [unclassified Microbacterium]MCR2785736.1 SRPBCC family protein [Microbacterium sp. zg.B96]WIM17280.1 Clp protease N-terminal domain-containing protein [Microbacterium sp. zg-B96]
MSKFVLVAQTSQSLSIAAMEEASRLGLREADIEHLFLALVISDQSAGRALRSLGIDLDSARRAVEEQYEAQLTLLGIEAAFPEAGRIVSQETDGYQWSRRAFDLIVRSSGKDKHGDAAAVLRELVAEPSGSIAEILRRLGATSDELLERLDQFDSSGEKSAPTAAKAKGRVAGSTETFVPASIDEVWEFLADPARIPEWQLSVGSVDLAGQEVTPGAIWQGHAATDRPGGKPVKVKPQFLRRRIELVAVHRPERVAWRFAHPDATPSRPFLTEFTLAPTTGGTQVTIMTTWSGHEGWRRLIGFPLRPMQKFVVWMGLFQTGSALSRAFR